MKKNSKYGRNPKSSPKIHCVMVHFNDEELNRFLTMYEESQVFARVIFLKVHLYGQKFKVVKVEKTLVDCHTKLSDFLAQFHVIGTSYNQVVKKLRSHFSEKKAKALLYRLDKYTIDLVKMSQEIEDLSRKMRAEWE